MKKISAFGMYIKRLMRSRIFLKTLLYLLAGFIVINGILILLVLSGVFGKLPNAAELKRIQNPVATGRLLQISSESTPSTLMVSSVTVIGYLYSFSDSLVPVASTGKEMQQAMLSKFLIVIQALC